MTCLSTIYIQSPNFFSAASLEGGKARELNRMDFKGISYIPAFRGLAGRNGLARKECTFHSFPSKSGKNIGSFNEIKAKQRFYCSFEKRKIKCKGYIILELYISFIFPSLYEVLNTTEKIHYDPFPFFYTSQPQCNSQQNENAAAPPLSLSLTQIYFDRM